MIAGEKVLAVITARGGSKGIPRKNLRAVAGKPLIAWTIEAARKSRYLDRVVLSSEDDEIMRVAAEWGCEVPFTRPASLAQDDTPGIDPVLDALARLPGYGLVVLLQPTSPLRSADDIDRAIELCVERRAPACVSVMAASESPYWMFTLEEAKMRPLLGKAALPERRQDLPQAYSLNGAVYVARPPWLLETRSFLAEGTVAYVMPDERSVDIDEELDLKLAEILLVDKGQGQGSR
jgi:CMP-N,N'-diacetyllegionaminic acid synthase